MSSQHDGYIRRSCRMKRIDLNGRGYLSDQLGLSIDQLESWMRSEGVMTHLDTWHRRCVEEPSNYNVVLQIINAGVFQIKDNNFEEELLLSSLGDYSLYDEEKTTMSFAMDFWAATVRRIVQNSLGVNHVFAHLHRYHTARLHAIVIDMLCLAFHSIAHRGEDSWWFIFIRSRPLTQHDLSVTTNGLLSPSVASSDGHDSAIGGMDLGHDYLSLKGPSGQLSDSESVDGVMEDEYQCETDAEVSSDED